MRIVISFADFVNAFMFFMGYATIAAIILYFGLKVLKFVKAWGYNRSADRIAVPARVVERQIAKIYYEVGAVGGTKEEEEKPQHQVVFETEPRAPRLSFLVKPQEYDKLAVGRSGILTYKGRKYISFQ